MGRGSNANNTEDSRNNYFTWKEIKESNKWIVINEKVYNIENFSKIHPGGERIIMNHVTQDATDAFNAFHNDLSKVSKYMKTIEIGKLLPNDKNLNITEKSRVSFLESFFFNFSRPKFLYFIVRHFI